LAAAEWAADLPRVSVVTYCVYGFQYGQDAASALRERGFEAQHLRGGLSAWKAAGGAVERIG
jgi:rhodanese-related sulfurtransferase